MTPGTTTNDPRRDFALEVVKRLRERGFQALWAGGCVRDALIGLRPTDYDVATDATPDAVMMIFRHTVPVGVSFGVVRVLGPPDAGEVEVATFRSDGEYHDGRRPVSVRFGTPEADAERRDFTINGLFFDPIAEEVIDFVGGRSDLANRVLRAIGDPVARFTEDKLRLLRAVRFLARFELKLDPVTEKALRSLAPDVVQVAAERIAQELHKILTHPTRAAAIDFAQRVGVLDALFPQLAALQGQSDLTEPELPRPDLWRHTLDVLNRLPDDASFPLAFAALWHEAEHIHAESDSDSMPSGGAKVKAAADRLKLSNDERDRIVWLVERHRSLLRPRELGVAALKRLLAAPGIRELLDLHRADALASSGRDEHVAWCESYLRDQPDGPIDPPPLVTGRDLIDAGLSPGPRFKELLNQIRDAQLEGSLTTRDEAIAWLRKHR